MEPRSRSTIERRNAFAWSLGPAVGPAWDVMDDPVSALSQLRFTGRYFIIYGWGLGYFPCLALSVFWRLGV